MEETLGGVRKDTVVGEGVCGGLGLQAEVSLERKREDKRYSKWRWVWEARCAGDGMFKRHRN